MVLYRFFIIILIFAQIILTSCATAGNKNNEIDRTQKDIGAVVVISGMAAGAYAGSRATQHEATRVLTSAGGGLLGAGAAGLLYRGILEIINSASREKEKSGLKHEDKILMPEN